MFIIDEFSQFHVGADAGDRRVARALLSFFFLGNFFNITFYYTKLQNGMICDHKVQQKEKKRTSDREKKETNNTTMKGENAT